MTELIKPSRRFFVAGLASLIAAPAIVRAASLMPVRSPPVGVFTPVALPASAPLSFATMKMFFSWDQEKFYEVGEVRDFKFRWEDTEWTTL